MFKTMLDMCALPLPRPAVKCEYTTVSTTVALSVPEVSVGSVVQCCSTRHYTRTLPVPVVSVVTSIANEARLYAQSKRCTCSGVVCGGGSGSGSGSGKHTACSCVYGLVWWAEYIEYILVLHTCEHQGTVFIFPHRHLQDVKYCFGVCGQRPRTHRTVSQHPASKHKIQLIHETYLNVEQEAVQSKT
jgi:hypothetical protein